MGEKRRTYQAGNGVRRSIITDVESSGVVHLATESDVEPVLDSIARDQETMRHGVNKLAARIPLFIYEDLQRKGVADDPDAFKKWLNGPEAAPWRIWKGSL